MTNYLKVAYRKVYFKYLLTIIWTLIITYLSLAQIPDNKEIKIDIPHLDKIVHFMMYFIYTLLLHIETKKINKKSAIALIALYSISFGLLMEFCQTYLFSYRSGEFFDFIFNTLGVLSAIAIYPKLHKITKT